MIKSQKNKTTLEDQLADFTDSILSENTAKSDGTSFALDPELRDLQQTALRLKNAFHEDGLSEAVIQRMRENIAVQWEKQKQEERKSFWNQWLAVIKSSKQKWQSQRSRRRLLVATSLAALLVLLLVCIPFFDGIDSNQPATSGQHLNTIVLVTSVGLVLLAVWLFRRKR